MRIERWQRRILAVSACQFLIVVSCLVLVRAQSQEVINAIVDQRVTTMAERVSKIEAAVLRADADGRLKVLESDMSEVKWLTRSVAMIVLGQLATMLLGLKNGRTKHA